MQLSNNRFVLTTIDVDMLLQRKAIVFLLLNGVRVISLFAIISVFASLIYLIVKDSNTYAALHQDGTLGEFRQDCEYLPSSNVPTTTLGIFWAQLNRSWCLVLCVLLTLAETGSKGSDALFRKSLPILSSSYGTAPTGFVQIVLATSLLSHYLKGYVLVSAWLLCCVGLLNVFVGLVFGAKGKLRRSFNRRNRDKYEEINAKEKQNAESLFTCITKLSKVGIADFGKRIKRQSAQLKRKDRRAGEHETLLPHHHDVSQPRVIPTAFEAFKGRSTYGVGVPRSARSVAHERQLSSSTTAFGAPTCDHDEVLRWRARQENIRVEKMTEGGVRRTSSLADSFSTYPQNRNLSAEIDCSINKLKQMQEVHMPIAQSRRKSFKRRTLVLSKMVASVKRSSVSAATAARMHVNSIRNAPRRTPVPLPPMPGAYARTSASMRRGLPSNDRATAWTEVESDRGSVNTVFLPPRSYKPDTFHSDRSHCEKQYHLPMAMRRGAFCP